MEKKLLELVNSINSEVRNLRPVKSLKKIDGIFYTVDNIFLIGLPFLNHVLLWHSLNESRRKYSHFEVRRGIGYFVIYDNDETFELEWDLNQDTIDKQNNNLIDWLYSII